MDEFINNIKWNLEAIEEVKKDYPIVVDYIEGKISKSSLNNNHIYPFIDLIDYNKECKKYGIELVYTEGIPYNTLRDKIVEFTTKPVAKRIFKNKSKKDFDSLWTENKLIGRYRKWQNESYCNGLEIAEPMIINYLAQNNIKPLREHIKKSCYTSRLVIPNTFKKEFSNTQEFISSFVEYANDNLDLRRCNISTLLTELQFKLKEVSKIEKGLIVKNIDNVNRFTIDKSYIIIDSHINYNGFIDICLDNDEGERVWKSYSLFEEVSKKRDLLLNSLGL